MTSENPALRAHFDSYAEFHRTPGNQLCHQIAIPAIVLSTLALFALVSLVTVAGFTVTLADVVFLFSTIFYFRLDPPLAARLTAFTLVCLVAARFIPLAWSASIFVISWIVQFIGHYVYEGKSPAFLTNVVHLLIGPLWVAAKLSGRA
jgi:uncharacterized membrane protein YGL010W